MKIKQNNLIAINQYLDFCPFVSAGTNLINLITKIAVDIFVKSTGISKEQIFQKNIYLRYIDQQDYFATIALMIPGINIGVAYVLKLDRAPTEISRQTDEKVLHTINALREFKTCYEELNEKPGENWRPADFDKIYAAFDRFDKCLGEPRGLPRLGLQSVSRLLQSVRWLDQYTSFAVTKSLEMDDREGAKDANKEVLEGYYKVKKQKLADHYIAIMNHLADFEILLEQNQ
jgi:hypothetical protein